MSIYLKCRNCGCSTEGVAIFLCNNPDCHDMCCGRCQTGGMSCGCSWEEGNSDDGYYTSYGTLFYAGKICSQAEWDTEIEREKMEERRRKIKEMARINVENVLNERYRNKLKNLPSLYRITYTKIESEEITSAIIEVPNNDLYYENKRLDLSLIQEINRSHPCGCCPECTQPHGGGYILMKDRTTLKLQNWKVKKGFWNVTYLNYTNLAGTFSLRIWGDDKIFRSDAKDTEGLSGIDISRILSLSVYTQSIDDRLLMV